MHVATRRSLLSRRAAAGGWAPTDLASLTAWYDFSDADTLFTDAGSTKVTTDGDLIYQANDKSGNDYHMVQTTEDARPPYKVAQQNGLSTALFDGTNYMTHAAKISTETSGFLFTVAYYVSALNGEGFTAFSVADKDADNYWFSLCTLGYDGNRRNPYVRWQNGGAATYNRDYSHRSWSGYGIIGIFSLPSKDATYNGSCINGGTLYQHSYGAGRTWGGDISNCDTSGIGAVPSNTPQFFSKQSMGEIILLEPEPSLADINAVGNYLATKWGLTWTDVS